MLEVALSIAFLAFLPLLALYSFRESGRQHRQGRLVPAFGLAVLGVTAVAILLGLVVAIWLLSDWVPFRFW